MSLAEEVQELRAASQVQRRCKVAVIAEQLGEEGAELMALSRDPQVFLIDLIRVLGNRGIKVSDKPLGKHRRGDCECPRPRERRAPGCESTAPP